MRITNTNQLALEPGVKFVPCCYSQQERVRGRVCSPAAPHRKGEKGRTKESGARQGAPGQGAVAHSILGMHHPPSRLCGAAAWRGGITPIPQVFSLRWAHLHPSAPFAAPACPAVAPEAGGELGGPQGPHVLPIALKCCRTPALLTRDGSWPPGDLNLSKCFNAPFFLKLSPVYKGRFLFALSFILFLSVS